MLHLRPPPDNDPTIVIGYTTYAVGRHDKTAEGVSIIQVQSSKGKSCTIKAITATDKVLDVQGDHDVFVWWMKNEKKKVR